jgi:c-di-GMP-binding flagellar brake protein YcgR
MFTKKEYKAQNSRRFKRMRADYLVKYQMAGTVGEPFVSNIKDLSAGGVKFWTDQFIPEGTLAKVSFLVPPLDLNVEALGRVVRVRQAKESGIFYLAIRFIEVPDEAKRAINDFIEYLAAQSDARGLVEHAPLVKRVLGL